MKTRLTSSQQFIYQPLDTTLLSIRLLRVELKPNGSSSFFLEEGVVLPDLSKPPPYMALSYTWGPPTSTRQIVVNGQMLTIRQNLFDFLCCFRPTSAGLDRLWIDQICIDQHAVHERNHQVSMMAEIYRRAAEVIIWLGTGDDSTDLAMRFLHLSSQDRFHRPSSMDFVDFSDFFDRQSDTSYYGLPTGLIHPEINDWMFESLMRDGEHVWKPALLSAFRGIMARAYWKRLWILQEVIVAKVITVVCGKQLVLWTHFEAPVRGNERWHPLYQAMDRQHVGRKLILAHKLFEADFHRLVIDFCANECQDPRDKVYGLRGLLRHWQRYDIIVDYAKSVEQVYMCSVNQWIDVLKKVTNIFLDDLEYVEKTWCAEFRIVVAKAEEVFWEIQQLRTSDLRNFP